MPLSTTLPHTIDILPHLHSQCKYFFRFPESFLQNFQRLLRIRPGLPMRYDDGHAVPAQLARVRPMVAAAKLQTVAMRRLRRGARQSSRRTLLDPALPTSSRTSGSMLCIRHMPVSACKHAFGRMAHCWHKNRTKPAFPRLVLFSPKKTSFKRAPCQGHSVFN